jgi:hypothetical protein
MSRRWSMVCGALRRLRARDRAGHDNSRDGTAAVIDRLAADDPRIVAVHRSPPNGVGRPCATVMPRRPAAG